MAIILGTLCSNGVPLASFEKFSYLAPLPPVQIVWGGGGGTDSHKTCKRLLITVEITFSYFSLKYYQVSQGLMALIATMAIILGTLCSNGVPLASFEKFSYLAPLPPVQC